MMRYFGLTLLLFLLPLDHARAQWAWHAPQRPEATSRLEVPSSINVVAAQQSRDHLAGAGYGLAIGAATGAIGFAGLTYLGNHSEEGKAYWPLALLVGSVAGGTAGLVIGAIIGAPEREEPEPARARLILSPTTRGDGVAAALHLLVPNIRHRRR